MAKRLTQEEFVSRCSKVHNDKYDYKNTLYTGSKEKISIVCSTHGEFQQTASSHQSGRGCTKCAYEMLSENNKTSTEDFVKAAHSIHGDKYDYSLVDYKSSKTNVVIGCHSHGPFPQHPSNHLSGAGCPSCALDEQSKRQTRSTQEFIDIASKVHKGIYDYSKVKYLSSKVPVEIVCGHCGETFFQKPSGHLSGLGCHKCAKKRSEKAGRLGNERFINKSVEVHAGKYNYDKVEYVLDRLKVEIVCNTCGGSFKQTPDNHLQGHGCPRCSNNGGFSSLSEGILYVLRFNNLTKIGITNKTAEYRARLVSNSFRDGVFSVTHVYRFVDGQTCSDIETEMLRKLRVTYKNPDKKFSGYSETFVDVDNDTLISDIENMIEERSKNDSRPHL